MHEECVGLDKTTSALH